MEYQINIVNGRHNVTKVIKVGFIQNKQKIGVFNSYAEANSAIAEDRLK